MLTLWSPPLPELIHRHQKTHTCHTQIHTSTHAHTQIIKCPTQNIPETILKLLSVNKQTPTYSSDRIGADVQIGLVHTGCCLWSFFKLCAILCLSCMIQTYVYKCKPTTIQHVLNTPGRHYLLRVKSWKPCELQRATRLTLCRPFSIVLNSISMGYWLPPCSETAIPRTHTLKNTSSDKGLLVVVLLGERSLYKSTEGGVS